MSKKAKHADAEQRKRHAAGDEAVGTEKRASDDRRMLLISRAIADPTRLSILRSIAEGKGRCGSLRASLTISAATLSHHMRELEKAGVIVVTREGRFLHAALDRKIWKHYLSELKSIAQR